MIEWLGWKEPQSPSISNPLLWAACLHQVRLPRAPSILTLNVYRDGAPAALWAACASALPSSEEKKKNLPNIRTVCIDNTSDLFQWSFCVFCVLPISLHLPLGKLFHKGCFYCLFVVRLFWSQLNRF